MLLLGWQAGSTGIYVLSAGFLSTTGESTGSGTSSFIQSGGTNQVDGSLYFGQAAGGVGSYSLSNGLLTVGLYGYVGNNGAGNFVQSGGTHNVSQLLYLGYGAGGTGSYTLSNGALSVTVGEMIGVSGSGTFTQTGGSNATSVLSIAPGSSYSLTGGTLTFTGGLANFGGFTLGGTATLNVAGLVNLGRATLLDVSQVSLAAQANSLVILPPGTSAASFLQYSNAGGLTASAGAPITIPAGHTVNGSSGVCDDELVVLGTLTGSATLYGGILVEGASASASATLVQVDNLSSGITGGTLQPAAEYVGYDGLGSFCAIGGYPKHR